MRRLRWPASSDPVWRFNPYHDKEGRFAPALGGSSGALDFVPEGQAEDRLLRSHAAWAGQLAEEETRALGTYVGSLAYEDINRWLRLGEEPKRFDPLVVEDSISGLDAAIERPEAALPAAYRAYRGVSGRTLAFLEKALDQSDLVQDNGFTSVTLKARVATRFKRGAGALLRIELPPGTPAAFVPAVLKGYPSSTERELILSRGAVYRVRREDSGYVLTYVGFDNQASSSP